MRLSVCVALRVFGVCVFKTACVREVVYTNKSGRVYMYLYINKHMCINVCVHGCGVCVCAWVCVCMGVCVHGGVCAWVCVCMGVYVHGGIYAWGYAYMGVCVYRSVCASLSRQPSQQVSR